ncbi:MAG: lysylphosphatidylglycerol synthase transmembrane domain-containing protein [Elusimicrobiota bacterium]
MKKRFIFGIIIGAVFLFLTLRQIDFANTLSYMRQINPLWIAIIMVVYSSAFLVRSFRWKQLISPILSVSPFKLFSYLILGFFMNNLLPLRLGELIRAYITGNKFKISRSGVLATVVVERLFDGLTFVTLFLLTVMFLPFPETAKKSFFAGGILFLAVITALFFMTRHQEYAMRIMSRIPMPKRFSEKILHFFGNFIKGLQIFGNVKGLVTVFVLSLCVWSIEGFVFYLMNIAFHMGLNYFQMLFVMIIIGMGAILPPAPGYVGTVEFLGVMSLSILNVDKNLAFGFILTLHILQLLTISFWGIRSLIKEKITLSELIRIEKQKEI